jgi:hypothetical protein
MVNDDDISMPDDEVGGGEYVGPDGQSSQSSGPDPLSNFLSNLDPKMVEQAKQTLVRTSKSYGVDKLMMAGGLLLLSAGGLTSVINSVRNPKQ